MLVLQCRTPLLWVWVCVGAHAVMCVCVQDKPPIDEGTKCTAEECPNLTCAACVDEFACLGCGAPPPFCSTCANKLGRQHQCAECDQSFCQTCADKRDTTYAALRGGAKTWICIDCCKAQKVPTKNAAKNKTPVSDDDAEGDDDDEEEGDDYYPEKPDNDEVESDDDKPVATEVEKKSDKPVLAKSKKVLHESRVFWCCTCDEVECHAFGDMDAVVCGKCNSTHAPLLCYGCDMVLYCTEHETEPVGRECLLCEKIYCSACFDERVETYATTKEYSAGACLQCCEAHSVPLREDAHDTAAESDDDCVCDKKPKSKTPASEGECDEPAPKRKCNKKDV